MTLSSLRSEQQKTFTQRRIRTYGFESSSLSLKYITDSFEAKGICHPGRRFDKAESQVEYRGKEVRRAQAYVDISVSRIWT